MSGRELWADPRLVYVVAGMAVALLIATVWLFGRKRKQGRQAGMICLVLSVGLHIALVLLVPLIPSADALRSERPQPEQEDGFEQISLSTFDPELDSAEASSLEDTSSLVPLPLVKPSDVVEPSVAESTSTEITTPAPIDSVETEEMTQELAATGPTDWTPEIPEPLSSGEDDSDLEAGDLDSQLSDLLELALADESPAEDSSAADRGQPSINSGVAAQAASSGHSPPRANVVGSEASDFANRQGTAKRQALVSTGGDEQTERAVEAALRFLSESQRADGAWDPRSSGAGIERSPLGMSRGAAGANAESAITGLALLALLGSGHTHQQGEYADSAYRGLAYLIQHQAPNGSFAGNASFYAANYSHGMAALSICEAAAMTGDPSAVTSARRAIRHTLDMQHPTTGGWRYRKGEKGDLSQLGWQAMVLDAGHRAGIDIAPASVAGVQRFLRSVRMGTQGGLASYRRGEVATRTMTAEALATRLLLGETVPANEIAEAERFLLAQPPGTGQDNYYYWYYATLALHQLQDDAWRQWNQALKQRLLSTQRPDGSWPSDSLWGGYGGTIYTTAMATLCLETYYRHTIRSKDRLASQVRNRR